MSSVKAMKFENDMLALSAKVKELILVHVSDVEGKMQLQGAVNDIYERAHEESRNLRKSLAYLHNVIEGKDTSGFGATVQEVNDHGKKTSS